MILKYFNADVPPQNKSFPLSISINPQGTHFAIMSVPDRQVRIFSYASGKLVRKYDESLTAATEMHQAGSALYAMDDMDFGRRTALEREIANTYDRGGILGALREQPVWDESGHFLLYPTILGIKVVNTSTNTVSRMIGRDETNRWLDLSLFQGTAAPKRSITTVVSPPPHRLDFVSRRARERER